MKTLTKPEPIVPAAEVAESQAVAAEVRKLTERAQPRPPRPVPVEGPGPQRVRFDLD